MGYWFAPSPSKQERSRISLNFGLGRADRMLRERVVPGLGRVWFVRQLSWPVAALALRNDLRGANGPRASAISHGLEALGCKLEWTAHPDAGRILGKRAFGRDHDEEIWSFDKLRTTKHYVQNTHRQAATRTLHEERGLGLATGSRFDVYELTSPGEQLAAAFLDQTVGKGGGSLHSRLAAWLRGEDIDLSRTARRALGPSSPSDTERALVRARVFDTVTSARRRQAANAVGLAREPRDMPDVARRLREAGHDDHANDVEAAHAFGLMLDRARDLAAAISERVDQTQRGWAIAESAKDGSMKHLVAALRKAGGEFLAKSAPAEFAEPRSMRFATGLTRDVEQVVAAIARTTSEVFSVADDRIQRGPLFRVVESSSALRDSVRNQELEDGADSLEPDSTDQTFRLANLHALARDLDGKPS